MLGTPSFWQKCSAARDPVQVPPLTTADPTVRVREESRDVGVGGWPRLSLSEALSPPSSSALASSCPVPLAGQWPSGTTLTHTAGLVAGPLVVPLTGDDSLPHQLEGGLALEGERVSVEEAAARPPPIGRDAGVPAAPLFNF